MGVLCMMVSIIATCIGIACLYRQHIKDKKFLAPAQEPIPQELLIDSHEVLTIALELGMDERVAQYYMTVGFYRLWIAKVPVTDEKLPVVREVYGKIKKPNKYVPLPEHHHYSGSFDEIAAYKAQGYTDKQIDEKLIARHISDGGSFHEWKEAEAYMNLRRQGDHSSADILASTMIKSIISR